MSEDETDFDRAAILARRRRFVAAALTGLTTSTLATACPCLKVAPDEPMPPPDDSGESASATDTEGASSGDGASGSDEASGGEGAVAPGDPPPS